MLPHPCISITPTNGRRIFFVHDHEVSYPSDLFHHKGLKQMQDCMSRLMSYRHGSGLLLCLDQEQREKQQLEKIGQAMFCTITSRITEGSPRITKDHQEPPVEPSKCMGQTPRCSLTRRPDGSHVGPQGPPANLGCMTRVASFGRYLESLNSGFASALDQIVETLPAVHPALNS